MKRDMDLIREILLWTERAPAGTMPVDFSSLTETNAVTIAEHVWLAHESGLLDAVFVGKSPSAGVFSNRRLTSAGHDFLAQATKPTLWMQAKDTAEKTGVGLTLDVLKTILTELAKAAVQTHFK